MAPRSPAEPACLRRSRSAPSIQSDAQAFQRLRLEGLETSPEAFASSYEEEVSLPIETVSARIPPPPDRTQSSAPSPMGTLSAWRGFAAHDRMKARHKGVMWGVYVKPEWRGQRVGKALVRQVIDHAARHVIVLEAAVTHHERERPAHLSGLGFQPYGIERKAIRVGDTFYDEELLFLEFRGA